MWVSDRWTDYELIDCGRGEKLERWGDQLLVRPDPQAIWNTPRTHPGLEASPRAVCPLLHRRAGSGRRRTCRSAGPSAIGGLTFNIKPMNFKHTGLFPEQAANWDFAQEQIRQGRDGPSGCSTCSPTPAEPPWPAPPPGPACAMWTPPGAWCPVGPGERQELWTGGRPYPLDRG